MKIWNQVGVMTFLLPIFETFDQSNIPSKAHIHVQLNEFSQTICPCNQHPDEQTGKQEPPFQPLQSPPYTPKITTTLSFPCTSLQTLAGGNPEPRWSPLESLGTHRLAHYFISFVEGRWYPPDFTDEETEVQSRVFDQAKRHICIRVREYVVPCMGRRGVVWGIVRVRSKARSLQCQTQLCMFHNCYFRKPHFPLNSLTHMFENAIYS